MAHDVNVVALLKGHDRYIYVFDEDSRQQLIDAVRDQASDPKHLLSWFDAAVLTERIRQIRNRTNSTTASPI
jgi:hypothetical protein